MDHSYRAAQGTNNGNTHRPNRGGRPGQNFGKQFLPPEPEPLPMTSTSDATPARIFAFVDDLFFMAKIQETARKMNVKVEFVKTEKDLNERMGQNGDDKPALIIFDLNNVSSKPLSIIPKLKTKLKKSHQHHWLPFARSGRAQDESPGSRMRHGGAALGIFAEPCANPAAPRRSRRIARAGTVGFEAVDQRDYLRRCEISGRCCCAGDVAPAVGKREIMAFFVHEFWGARRSHSAHLL